MNDIPTIDRYLDVCNALFIYVLMFVLDSPDLVWIFATPLSVLTLSVLTNNLEEIVIIMKIRRRIRAEQHFKRQLQTCEAERIAVVEDFHSELRPWKTYFIEKTQFSPLYVRLIK